VVGSGARAPALLWAAARGVVMSSDLNGEAVRSRIGHPVIDADGHTLELGPALSEYLRADGVAADLGGVFEGLPIFSTRWRDLSPQDRVRQRAYRSVWWWHPTRNTRDLATAYLPELLYHRLDELGIDVAVVYPSIGLMFPLLDHADRRQGACHSLNRYHADLFAPWSDRLLPVAVIPMHTPDEAIAELDHAVGTLGFRAVTMAGYVKRYPAEVDDRLDRGSAYWLDLLGIDSAHDFDPVWQRCADLGVAPTFHSGSQALGFRQSISSYIFNHLGNFAAGNEAVCRALFLGGVTNRFPQLRFGFMEGGVAWAAQLYTSLFSYWEKRNRDAMRNYDPAAVDMPLLEDLFAHHGSGFGRLGGIDLGSALGVGMSAGDEFVDEWASSGIECRADIEARFAEPFFFGCEADDPLVSLAFDGEILLGTTPLNAMFSSDISHWDVPDMAKILVEAHEAVEHGRLSPDEFRAFAFDNAWRFYTQGNPDFFAGTVLAGDKATARQ
jgi:predicted TIM-barrel fold metal-dependent hydrolase